MLLFLAAAGAMAADPMWGAGLHLGTWAIPNQFPSTFPKVDTNGDGSKETLASIDKTRGDFMFGPEGYFYVDEPFRLGLQATVDLGTRFTDLNAMVVGDYVFADGDQLDVFAGAGVGAGTMTWKGTAGEERLNVPYYPLKAELGAMLVPTEFLAPQLRLQGQWDIPSSHHYTTVGGRELDKKATGTGFYVNLGIELSVLYGKFD